MLARRRLLRGALAAASCATVLLPAALPAGATAPSGVRWTTELASPGVFHPLALSCPTVAVCTAAGDVGANGGAAMLVRTSDRGRSWVPEVPPQGLSPLTALSCPTVAFCLGTGSGSDQFFSLATTDGGQTWQLADHTGTAIREVEALDCVVADECFAVAESASGSALLVRTTDAGASWSSLTLGTGAGFTFGVAAGLDCVSAATCFVVRESASNPSAVQVLKVTDFTSVTTTYSTAAAAGAAPLGISCWSAEGCMATGLSPTHVLVTADGGSRWVSDALPPGVLHGLGVTCPLAVTCVVVGTSTGGYVAASSTDAGGSWSALGSVAQMPGAPEDSFGGLQCATASACLVAPDRLAPSLYATSDGGATWRAAPPPFGRPPLDWVACPTARHCVAVGEGDAMWSLTGGRTWYRAATPPPPQAIIESVACPVAALCLATGAGVAAGRQVGILYRSTNEGRTWVRVALPAGTSVVQTVACSSASSCFLGGDLGLLRSTDGGTTWSAPMITPATAPHVFPTSISCGTAMTCLAVGASDEGNHTVLSTTDGGATWTTSSLPASILFAWSVACNSATHCVTAGMSDSWNGVGELETLVTSTLGASWSAPFDYGVGVLPQGLACHGNDCLLSSGYLASHDQLTLGLLDSSTDGGATWTPSPLPSDALDVGNPTVSPALGFVVAGWDADNGPLVLSTHVGGP